MAIAARTLVVAVVAALLAAGPANAGSAASTVSADATRFVVALLDGRTLGSADLIGAVLSVPTGADKTDRIRIHSVSEVASPSGPLLLHDFEVERDGGWQPYCDADALGRRAGFPVAGRSTEDGSFDPSAPGFEIACTSGAVGKCLLLGYQPWRTTASLPMDRLFRSCVRMIRADYCGDGRSWTRAGMRIDVSDRFGVQKADNPPDMRFEAAWSPEGAVCVDHMRVAEIGSLQELAASCPRLAKSPVSRCDSRATADLFNNSVDSLARP